MTVEQASDVRIYATGLIYCSVCAPTEMPVETVEAEVNLHSPTGISTPWAKSGERFASGEPNPTPCTDDPTRLHYLMSC